MSGTAPKCVTLNNVDALRDWMNLQCKIRHATVTLTTTWQGGNPYSQAVTISGITANSKVDIEPDANVIAQMQSDGVGAIYIANNNGTLTAYAMQNAPSVSLTVPVSITEVTALVANG